MCPEIRQENPVGVLLGEALHNIGMNLFRAGPSYWLSGVITDRNLYLFTATGVKARNRYVDLQLKSKTKLTDIAFEQWTRADRAFASIYKFTESDAIWQFDKKYTDVMLVIRGFGSWDNQKLTVTEFVSGKGKAISSFENCLSAWREKAKNNPPKKLPAAAKGSTDDSVRQNEKTNGPSEASTDIESSLRQLQKLKEGGLLSDAEYEKKRSEILKRL